MLVEPLNFTSDSDYSISFPTRTRIVGMGVSIDTRERVTCWTGRERYNDGAVLALDDTYAVVMKINSRETEPDNVMARV